MICLKYLDRRKSALSRPVLIPINPKKEVRDLLDGTARRPGDVLLPSWFQGRDVALDLTVVTPIQGALTVKAAAEGGAAAEHSHREKLAKSYDECRVAGVEFIPLACETWGGWHPEALRVIKKLAMQMARHVGKDENTTTCHVLQRLAILLQRGNVALLTSRVPEHPAPEEDGDLDEDGWGYIPQ